MKKWLLLIPLFALGGLIFWRFQQKTAEGAGQMGGGMRGGPASVELAIPQTRDILKTFQATGGVEAMQSVQISSKTSGRLEYLEVREGDHVTPGQVLARLNQSEVLAQVRQQEANLAEAKFRLAQAQLNQIPVDMAVTTQIRQQEANLANAEGDLRQAQQTHTAQVAGIEATLEDAQSKIENAAATVTSAEADLRQAQQTRAAQLEGIKASLDDAQTKIASSTASVANAAALQKSAQANLENATAKYDRVYGLYQQGYVAAQDVDDAKTAMRVQQANVETAKGQWQAAVAAQDSAKAQQRGMEQQTAITRAKADTDLDAARARLTQTKAALASTQAQKRSVEQQTNITRVKAETDTESARNRVAQAKAALDNARANAKSSPAFAQSLEALRAGVAAAQASLENIRVRLADTVLTSPLDGVVTARSLEPGAMASAGQAILTVQAIDYIWVTIAVPEDVCQRLRVGQPTTVTFATLGDRAFTARIAQINPAADTQSRQYTVRVSLKNSEHHFAPGMFAKVTLVTEEARKALAVPSGAVQQEQDGSQYVYAVGKDNTVKRRVVVTGISDAQWTHIVAGVTVGEKVVTMSAMPLQDGQEVRAAGGRRKGGPGGEGRRGGRGAGRPQRGNRDGN